MTRSKTFAPQLKSIPRETQTEISQGLVLLALTNRNITMAPSKSFARITRCMYRDITSIMGELKTV